MVDTKLPGALFGRRLQRLVRLAALSWVLLLTSCGPETELIDGRVHPDLELALAEPGARQVKSSVGAATRGLNTRDWPVMESFPRDSTAFLGNVEDVYVSAQKVALLDASQASVHLFDADGVHLASFGRPGNGPNEIAHGQAVAVADDRVVVAQRTQVVKVFAESEQGVYLEEGSFTLPGLPYDVCAIGEELFFRLSDADSDSMIQVYSLDGEHIRGFGKRYPVGIPLARAKMSEEGKVACLPDKDTIVVSWTYQPFVAAFDKSGDQLWHTRIVEHTVPSIEERSRQGRPGLRFHSPEEGDLWPVALGVVRQQSPNSWVAASYQEIGGGGAVVIAYLDVGTGGVVAADTAGYRAYGDTWNGLLVTGTEIPAPEVSFRRAASNYGS